MVPSTLSNISTRNVKFRPGGPPGPKVQSRPDFLRSLDYGRQAHAGLGGGDHKKLCIGCRVGCFRNTCFSGGHPDGGRPSS